VDDALERVLGSERGNVKSVLLCIQAFCRGEAMLLRASCRLTFEVKTPTAMILMLRPRSGAGQWVTRETYAINPQAAVYEYTDSYGNLCQRLVAPEGPFEVLTEAEVETAATIDTQPGAPFTPVDQLPDSAIPFLLPSRYCESDRLLDLAQNVVGDAQPGYDQAAAICDWIHQNVTYRYGTSDASTSARDTAEGRVGVCRDFAHLGVALCRSMSLPARMVVGYLHRLDPMDMHAWFEVFAGGRWYTFDATQEAPRGGRIVVAYGRDAADVAVATVFGSAQLGELAVQVEEVPAGA
jgi:transglutaminase-like putative cysteine protease